MSEATPPPVALETRTAVDARLSSPSAARNRAPIGDIIRRELPARGRILEIGSGTGEHVVHYAALLPEAQFFPGDPDAASRASIAAWTAHLALRNVAAPHALDVASPAWQSDAPKPIDVVVAANVIHIAPFAAAEGLMRGAAALLARDGLLFLYGPFARNGAHTAPSNEEFDRSLKQRDARWGVRDLDREIAPLAADAGFSAPSVFAMPANNLSIVFRRR